MRESQRIPREYLIVPYLSDSPSGRNDVRREEFFGGVSVSVNGETCIPISVLVWVVVFDSRHVRDALKVFDHLLKCFFHKFRHFGV